MNNGITKDNISLELAKRLTKRANEAWESGEMQESVTPVTRHLLDYWFGEAHCEQRERNFHIGQRQAILNIIYLHEVLKVGKVEDYYTSIAADLMAIADMQALKKEKYQMPKYAVKMATGTGKTWVMLALMVWQLLNARHESESSGRFTKNFLVVAPGLIVYDRLLDAFCGRIRREDKERSFETCDFYINKELLLPEMYRPEVFSFIQNNTVTKQEGIGRKTTGEGLIALTNWHLFENQVDEAEEDYDLDDTDPKTIVNDLLRVRPGKAAGNDLSTIDGRYLKGNEIEYLAGLKDLMIINDEAHHIHELKRNGEVEEVEWQRGLNIIARGKGSRCVQIDFSATPYDTRGSGNRKVNCYFSHIVVDFDLLTAMRQGLVKTLLLDQRENLCELEYLDYKAVRDESGKVVGLSKGQMLMILEGLDRLRKLKEDFLKTDTEKNPKMLIVCEDTNVSPFVVDFLLDEGLQEDDVLRIDSNKQGEVGEQEWAKIKTQLFDLDRYKKPEVIVSVLMLREGFDVNNICVIVPLRSTGSNILLEQTIGRGLRLMWREKEYQDTKREDRELMLKSGGTPKTLLDKLIIVEHPRFLEFYEQMLDNSDAAVDYGAAGNNGAAGDLIKVGLKENYEAYDLCWPIIVRDTEETLPPVMIDINKMRPFRLYDLNTLRRFLAIDGETFVLNDIITETRFGRNKIYGDWLNANSYNEYLQKILNVVTSRLFRITSIGKKFFPNIQVDMAVILGTIDSYIRTRLFEQAFNPFNGSDWKILLAKNGAVTEHIVKELAEAIYHLQENIEVSEAQVEHFNFSCVAELVMREMYSQPLRKTIYERTGYPSHNGNLEKEFEKFLDRDAEVERFIKIHENRHSFAVIYYIRHDGLMATYHPDFLVTTKDKIYLIETKGNDKIDERNVRQKQRATIEWTRKINQLQPEQRMGREWEYVLLKEDDFYSLSANGATLVDICNINKVSMSSATGDLFA
ncbi:MAG: DEAD/DEAH box helicase family protein [Prevotellaceae bacterium]|nr:DEAD/DEAH box helicase family protein [Prevotellaceae bacterium]